MRVSDNVIKKGEIEGNNFLLGESEMAAAATADKPGNEHSFSPVHIYQEVVGYTKQPKNNEKGRAGNERGSVSFRCLGNDLASFVITVS